MNFKLKQKIMHTIQQYQEFLSDYLQSQYETKEPRNLYEPIHYILDLGGKKMRPVLTLMSAEVLMPIIKALPALAVEVFIIFISA
jgi:geranylgeranyl diphosphate synthase type II